MFKLKNGEIQALNSPVMQTLFDDQNRHFPVEDAFRLADILQQSQAHLIAYKNTARSIIEKHLGTITATGAVKYPSDANRDKAMKEVNTLNALEVELTGERLKPSGPWPQVSLSEATVLKAIMDQ